MLQLRKYFKIFTYSICGWPQLYFMSFKRFYLLSLTHNYFFPQKRVDNFLAKSSHFEWCNTNINGEREENHLTAPNDWEQASAVCCYLSPVKSVRIRLIYSVCDNEFKGMEEWKWYKIFYTPFENSISIWILVPNFILGFSIMSKALAKYPCKDPNYKTSMPAIACRSYLMDCNSQIHSVLPVKYLCNLVHTVLVSLIQQYSILNMPY